MRIWKDKGLPLKNQKLYAFALIASFGIAAAHYFEYGYLSIENIIGIALAGFLVYGIWFGGIYKIARWNAERLAKKRDNNWKPKWSK